MDDDIDDLLDEVENTFIHRKPSRTKASGAGLAGDGLRGSAGYSSHSSQKLSGSSTTTQDRQKPKKNDVDDLLNDLHDLDPNTGLHPLASIQPEGAAVAVKRKCYPVYLGGTDMPAGLGTAVNVRVCDALRCTDCDFRVSTFDNFKWMGVDYLFLRNHMPDFERVRARLVPKKGFRAFACQCQARSINVETDLMEEKGLKWVCGKH